MSFSLSPSQIGLLAAVAVLLFWAIGGHNRLVSLRNAIGAAWVQVDTSLLRRGALIQTWVTELRAELAAEEHALETLLSASAQVAAAADAVRPRPAQADTVAALVIAETLHVGALAHVRLLIAERPALQQREALERADGQLVEIESQLDYGRRLFNDAVVVYNTAARQFPTWVLSAMFGFGPGGRL